MLEKQPLSTNCIKFTIQLIDYRLLDEVVATTPTIGGNVEELVYKNVRFLMWDIGGQGAFVSFMLRISSCVVAYVLHQHTCTAQSFVLPLNRLSLWWWIRLIARE